MSHSKCIHNRPKNARKFDAEAEIERENGPKCTERINSLNTQFTNTFTWGNYDLTHTPEWFAELSNYLMSMDLCPFLGTFFCCTFSPLFSTHFPRMMWMSVFFFVFVRFWCRFQSQMHTKKTQIWAKCMCERLLCGITLNLLHRKM